MATAEGYDPSVWRQLSEDLAQPTSASEQYGGAGLRHRRALHRH